MSYRKGTLNYSALSQYPTQPLKMVIVKTNSKYKKSVL